MNRLEVIKQRLSAGISNADRLRIGREFPALASVGGRVALVEMDSRGRVIFQVEAPSLDASRRQNGTVAHTIIAGPGFFGMLVEISGPNHPEVLRYIKGIFADALGQEIEAPAESYI